MIYEKRYPEFAEWLILSNFNTGRKAMPEPWEITLAQAKAEGRALRDAFAAADRDAFQFLARQIAEQEAEGNDDPNTEPKPETEEDHE